MRIIQEQDENPEPYFNEPEMGLARKILGENESSSGCTPNKENITQKLVKSIQYYD